MTATATPHFLRELFPKAGPALVRLLQGVAENTGILRNDYFAVRDWLEIADYRDCDSACVLALLLLAALEEGSLCVEISEDSLGRRLNDFVSADEARQWIAAVVRDLDESTLPALIGTLPGEHRPMILHTVGDRRFVYFQRFLRAESAFFLSLQTRVENVEAPSDTDWPAIVREVFTSQAVQLDPDQRIALASALAQRLTIISGGPGTGKTSIVLTLLRCLSRGGIGADRITLAAPTGRAAQRLTDSLRAGLARLPTPTDADTRLNDLSATTLHQMLAYRPNRNIFTRHRENPIPADVVIVDEVSMVGLVLMAQLFDAVAPNAKLILLGDKNQLPSVEAGAVLANLVADDHAARFTPATASHIEQILGAATVERQDSVDRIAERIVLLRTNHRSQAEIRAVAEAINRQEATIVDTLPRLNLADDDALSRTGCWLLEQTHATPMELRAQVRSWIDLAYFSTDEAGTTLAAVISDVAKTDAPEQHTDTPKLFALMDRWRLLTLVRDGAWGCDEINADADAILRHRLDPGARGALFAGAPVLITRNDPSLGLFNGDVGMAVRDARGRLSVLFPRREGCIAFAAETLPTHELGFALTVHKSQGSEYANVMVIMPPTGGRRLLTKELVYTAITRAKSLAVICSATEALRFAISRRIKRESGICAAGAQAPG